MYNYNFLKFEIGPYRESCPKSQLSEIRFSKYSATDAGSIIEMLKKHINRNYIKYSNIIIQDTEEK